MPAGWSHKQLRLAVSSPDPREGGRGREKTGREEEGERERWREHQRQRDRLSLAVSLEELELSLESHRQRTERTGWWRGAWGQGEGASSDLLSPGAALSLYLCNCRLQALSQLPMQRHSAQERAAPGVDKLHSWQ